MKKNKPEVGCRVYPDDEGNLYLSDGDYGFNPKSERWQVRPPGFNAGSIPHHSVVEHDDGTITVSPSIVLVDGEDRWHGFLERGVWRSV